MDWTTLLAIFNTLALILYVSVNSRSRIAVDRADESRMRADNEGKPLDAITVLAKSIDSRTEFEREQSANWKASNDALLLELKSTHALMDRTQDNADVRTRQVEKLTTELRDQRETLMAVQSGYEAQGPTLQETHEIVKGIQAKIDQLPEENKKLLETFLAKMEADWTTFKSEMVQSVVDAMIKQQAPPVSQNVTVNTAPPTLPETPALPKADGDDTLIVRGGMPNGQSASEVTT